MNLIPIEIKNRIEKYINIDIVLNSIISTVKSVNIQDNKNSDKLDLIINLEIINNIRRINKFHQSVNSKLNDRGIYVLCGETLEERRIRVKRKSPFGAKNIIRIVDFLYKRVIPKLPGLKKIYFAITRGHNRVISKAEILGRLISCGFKILEYFEHKNRLYVIAKKSDNPDFNMQASYGPFFKMSRIGYKGKMIGVYKLRTMYPYSEYCQNLIIKENALAQSGKIANDFRVTTWGRLFRRFWIDEIPMLINFFKRELNLVGVRPLSLNYFSRYPKDLQDLRIKVRPGLIPPYYADLPKNFDEIIQSERNYLKKKIKHPFITDFSYFFKAIFNIIFKGARSS